MFKLLRRDRDWIILFTLLAWAVEMTVLGDSSRAVLYGMPLGKPIEGFFYAHAALGLALGLLVGLGDRLRGTEDWLRHRPISAIKLTRRRHDASFLVLALAIFLPLLLRRLVAFDIDRDFEGRALVVSDDLARWGELLALGSLAFASYAAAFFATRLPGGFVAKVLCGASLVVIWLFCSWCFLEVPWRLRAMSFSMVQFTAVVGLLGIAHRNEGGAEDRDRPGGLRPMLDNVVVLGLALALGAGLVATEVQGHFYGRLGAGWPAIHRFADDFRLIGVVKSQSGDWELRLFDSRHASLDEGVALDDPYGRTLVGGPEFYSPGSRLMNDSLERGLGVVERHHQGARFVFVHRDGVTIYSDGYWAEPWLALDGRRLDLPLEGASRLSNEAGFPRFPNSWGSVGRRNTATGTGSLVELGLPVVLDPADQSWWRADMEAGLLRRLALPEGEIIRDFYPVAEEDSATGVAEVHFMGDFGDYRLASEGFVAVQGKPRSSAGLRAEFADRDPLAPLIVIRDQAGDEQFRHRYGAYRGDEKLLTAAVLGTGLLRSPLALCASFLADDIPVWSAKEVRAVLDPFTAGGRRIWLVGLGVAIGLLLATLQSRRLRRLGAGRGRCRLWFLACLLGGPALFLLAFLIERPRAHRALDLPKVSPCLLKSA